MSDVALRNSFKVDKFLGQVYLLVKKKDGGITWEKMIKDVAFNNPIFPDKINYQLYNQQYLLYNKHKHLFP